MLLSYKNSCQLHGNSFQIKLAKVSPLNVRHRFCLSLKYIDACATRTVWSLTRRPNLVKRPRYFNFFLLFFGNIFPRHFLFLLPQENPCQIKQNALSRNFCPRALLHLLFWPKCKEKLFFMKTNRMRSCAHQTGLIKGWLPEKCRSLWQLST